MHNIYAVYDRLFSLYGSKTSSIISVLCGTSYIYVKTKYEGHILIGYYANNRKGK